MVSSISRFGSLPPTTTRPAAHTPPASVRFGGERSEAETLLDHFFYNSPLTPQDITDIHITRAAGLEGIQEFRDIFARKGASLAATLKLNGHPFKVALNNTTSGLLTQTQVILQPEGADFPKVTVSRYQGEIQDTGKIEGGSITYKPTEAESRDLQAAGLSFRNTLLTALVAALPKNETPPVQPEQKKSFLQRLFGG